MRNKLNSKTSAISIETSDENVFTILNEIENLVSYC